MAAQPASHGMKFHARALGAQVAETASCHFFAGTTVVTEENEIRLLKFDAGKDTLKSIRSFRHPAEVWRIAASPLEPSSFATVYQEGGKSGAAIWSFTSEGNDLIQEAELESNGDEVKEVVWHPQDGTTAATLSEQRLSLWKIADGKAEVAESSALGQEGSASCCLAWSKKDSHVISTAGQGYIQMWDARDLRKASVRVQAHSGTIRDLDVANQNGHFVASCGDDCKAKIWDTRSFKSPVVSISNHAHWVWQCKFNPLHDQLLLTSSSDATVQLQYNPAMGNSAPKGAPASSPGSQNRHSSEANCAASYDSHEDSVYGVAWSSADPWVFGSISYDGRVIVGRVPSNVKYSILI